MEGRIKWEGAFAGLMIEGSTAECAAGHFNKDTGQKLAFPMLTGSALQLTAFYDLRSI
jgi:hypothetical protein